MRLEKSPASIALLMSLHYISLWFGIILGNQVILFYWTSLIAIKRASCRMTTLSSDICGYGVQK
jgi:hypothetical protein